MRKTTVSLLIALALLLAPLGTFNLATPALAYSGYPTFSIVSVVKDTSVTMKTSNLPPNDEFKVLMGKMGTRAVNGVKVTSIDSGTGGAITFTFDIPASLKGLAQIAIRLESKTGSGYFAYNWFYNSTTGGTGGPGPSPSPVITGIPTFSIIAVDRNKTVTIRTNNFPKKDTFDVLMGKMGTRGVGGYKVATFKSGKGGVLEAQFTIPAELKGQHQIAIRLQSTTGSGYFAYNWFYNNDAP
jgi:hypothetical protein